MAADDAAARARKSAACLIIVERGWTIVGRVWWGTVNNNERLLRCMLGPVLIPSKMSKEESAQLNLCYKRFPPGF